MKCILAAALAATAAAVTIRGGAEQASFSLSGSPKDLEESLLNLVGSKNTPALLKFVDQILEMVEKNMKPPVLKHHKEEQLRLDALPGAFKNCSASLVTEQAKVKGLCDAASSAQKEHATASMELTALQNAEKECLGKLKVFNDLQTSTCGLLASISKESNPCGCTLGAASYGPDAEKRAQCFTNQLQKWERADKGCSDAKIKAAEQKKTCDALTVQVKAKEVSLRALLTKMETAACTCATGSKKACDTSAVCNTGAQTRFRDTVKAVKVQEIGMKGEWESITRLQCLAASISRSDEVRPAAIRACRDRDVDTSLLDLKYPIEPKPQSCAEQTAFKCKR